MTDLADDQDLREQTISSECVFDGGLIRVRVDRVRMANGRETQREVVEHPGAVAILPLLNDGQVILLRQFRQPTGEVLWEAPAGTLKSGEDPQDCARRELAEETGYWPGSLELLGSVYVSPGYSSEMIHLFAARELKQVGPNTDVDERVQPIPLEMERVLSMIASGEIRDAKTVCAVLLARWRTEY